MTVENEQGTPVDQPQTMFSPDDNDPVIVAGREAELAALEAEKAPKADEPEKKPDEAPKAEADKPAKIMIPKERLDEVISEREAARREAEAAKSQATYLQGVVDVQRSMVAKPETKDQVEQPKTTSFEDQIVSAEAKKLELAEQYENGDLTLVELRKQEIELDRGIRTLEDQRRNAQLESVRKSSQSTASAEIVQARINDEMTKLKDANPYIAEINKLEDKDVIWKFVENKATQSLAQKGIPVTNSAESQILMLREISDLVAKEYGARYTGKTLDLSGQKQGGLSDAAKERSAKIDLSQNQPPAASGIGTSGDQNNLTEQDIVRMSKDPDKLADLYASMPNLVLRAVGGIK